MADLMSTTEIDLEVFAKYAGLSLPRHVSYPMPTGWVDMPASEFDRMLETVRERSPAHDWSLYVHIPFCNALCKFCACNRVIVPQKGDGWIEPAQTYVDTVVAELDRLQGAIEPQRGLRQVHWGGGSPTYLTADMTERLTHAIRRKFNLTTDAEVSMEVDPRHTTLESLRLLKQLGFNRLSMGVQDFDLQVQEHVHRVQPFDMVERVVEDARALGFESINFDLIYGMPYQTVETIRKTVELTIRLQPNRVAYYHYAQIPHKIATQRGMDYTKLPDSETKLRMFLVGLQLFGEAGYDFIGLDHFARPEELLAQAADDGTLQRNFQGMTTGGGLDLIGVGVSSISHFLEVGFTQNVKEIQPYQDCVRSGEWSTVRGKWLTRDDIIRQAVINQIYCSAHIDPGAIESRFGIEFSDYFERELEALKCLSDDGLVEFAPDGRITITTPLGRVLMRNISAVFDVYLHPEAYRVGDRDYFSANA